MYSIEHVATQLIKHSAKGFKPRGEGNPPPGLFVLFKGREAKAAGSISMMTADIQGTGSTPRSRDEMSTGNYHILAALSGTQYLINLPNIKIASVVRE